MVLSLLLAPALASAVSPATLIDTVSVHAERESNTGGFARVVIGKPVQTCFALLTDVNQWPRINRGVTQSVTPEGIALDVGARFYESIRSPVAGIDDWVNEWQVEQYIPNRSLVISGMDTFARVPVHSRITYTFTAQGPDSTLFERSIEVSLDQAFIDRASKAETEALYRFLGSQWEMAAHLKHYVENQPDPAVS
jgi:hypothetical protein